MIYFLIVLSTLKYIIASWWPKLIRCKAGIYINLLILNLIKVVKTFGFWNLFIFFNLILLFSNVNTNLRNHIPLCSSILLIFKRLILLINVYLFIDAFNLILENGIIYSYLVLITLCLTGHIAVIIWRIILRFKLLIIFLLLLLLLELIPCNCRISLSLILQTNIRNHDRIRI